MHLDPLTISQPSLRGTDTNSLLRLHDAAREIHLRSCSENERTRAGRTVERIVAELQRRNIVL